MLRLFKSLLFVCALVGTTFFTTYIYAQDTDSTPTVTPNEEGTATLTLTPDAAEITATVAITTPVSDLLSPTATPTPSSNFTSPLTTTDSTATTPTATAVVTASTTVTQSDAAEPLQGTILANRSDTLARFFLEGETYQLEAGLSQSLQLPRATTVLNLFNCAGDVAVETAGCFWDPYLIQQDGFYEIYDASAAGEDVKLMLREASAPPTGQVWVQNRTGQTESIVFRDEVFEIPPTAVLEFPVATGVPAILYVRSCLTIDNQSACEWAPKTLNAGVYYAMVEVDTPGSQLGTTLTTIELRPVVGAGEEAPAAEVASAPAIVCTVIVPALNIRSGPGLQYDIIGKVRATEGSVGTVNVTGRSADNEWLTVDSAEAPGGWINNSPSFITCNGDIAGLPIAVAPPTPTPPPVVSAPPTTTESLPAAPETAPQESAAHPVEATEVTTTTETGPAVPDGLAVLVVNNGFQHEMRFTLDQQYRAQEGPSEFDLQPGQSLSIVVYPGDIPFTASSPWGGLASNASIRVEPNQSLTLWLRFELEADGNWVFRWN